MSGNTLKGPVKLKSAVVATPFLPSDTAPHPAPEPAAATATPPVVEPVDYPRPAPPTVGDEAVHVPPPPHNEEETQRRDKRHDNERKLLELAQRKAEMTRPTRIPKNNVGKGFGAAGRIAQPAKELHL
ncbi:hypothetical protein MVEN_01472600 [Mycena venus]|uniref:Uncharacterized protein n=1 Tax=Mycena venus TaxID=2733690 RepID=A0A8H6XVH2_9AGAR|nr:hypothetical protein MVEN_01472600 [Mycena venus]